MTRNETSAAFYPRWTFQINALAAPIEPIQCCHDQILLVYAIITQNASLNAASSFVQCYKSASPPHPAPVISKGPTCFAMLKPKRLANQSMAYTKQGERRSSVWWRNGRAGSRRQPESGHAIEKTGVHTVVAQEANDRIVAQSY